MDLLIKDIYRAFIGECQWSAGIRMIRDNAQIIIDAMQEDREKEVLIALLSEMDADE